MQPCLSGLELYVLEDQDGAEAVSVVDVPASELAPHSVAFDHTSDRAKTQFASVTPYGDGPGGQVRLDVGYLIQLSAGQHDQTKPQRTLRKCAASV